jgi:hypothetical protein
MLRWIICIVLFQPKAAGGAREGTVKSVVGDLAGYPQDDVEAHPQSQAQLETAEGVNKNDNLEE